MQQFLFALHDEWTFKSIVDKNTSVSLINDKCIIYARIKLQPIYQKYA